LALKPLIASVDTGVLRRVHSRVVLDPTPDESLATMSDFLRGAHVRGQARFRRWRDAVAARLRPRRTADAAAAAAADAADATGIDQDKAHRNATTPPNGGDGGGGGMARLLSRWRR
jgi:hypothetical protein